MRRQDPTVDEQGWYHRRVNDDLNPGSEADFWTALRQQLLGQAQPAQAPAPIKMDAIRGPSSASPQDQNIDPAIAGPTVTMTGTIDEAPGAMTAPIQPKSPQSDGGSKKGGKRELSGSKRAAQNRAAQVGLF